jgi:hypothetical protein
MPRPDRAREERLMSSLIRIINKHGEYSEGL